MSLLVEMRGIEKRFPGVHALKNVRFDLKPGEVHALMGENGAGKSTLMKILSGNYQRDDGEIFFEGKPVDPDSPRAATDLGIGIIHQELSLMNDLTAAQNVFIGREPRKSFGRLDEPALNRQTADIFSSINPRARQPRNRGKHGDPRTEKRCRKSEEATLRRGFRIFSKRRSGSATTTRLRTQSSPTMRNQPLPQSDTPGKGDEPFPLSVEIWARPGRQPGRTNLAMGSSMVGRLQRE